MTTIVTDAGKNNSRAVTMDIQNCRICEHHVIYSFGEIFCAFWGSIELLSTERDIGNETVIGCPKAKQEPAREEGADSGIGEPVLHNF